MIDFTLLMLDVVRRYREAERPIFVWIYPERQREKWAIDTNEQAYEGEPTFVFGWPPEGWYESVPQGTRRM